MAQNFMCDTVALDAPHSDGWEESVLLRAPVPGVGGGLDPASLKSNADTKYWQSRVPSISVIVVHFNCSCQAGGEGNIIIKSGK
eukprot:g10425.t1